MLVPVAVLDDVDLSDWNECEGLKISPDGWLVEAKEELTEREFEAVRYLPAASSRFLCLYIVGRHACPRKRDITI